VRRYGQWLNDPGLVEPAMQARIERLLERLREDRISIAFVAEFSRGKSELINAIFFRRIRSARAALVGRSHHDVPDRADVRPGPARVGASAADRDTDGRRLGGRTARVRRDAWHEIPVESQAMSTA
jgi:hypothetical protein